MDSTVNVEIHRSQFPDRLQAELADCLRARRINHKFHYESHKQVQRWLALHDEHSPARADPGVEQIYAKAFDDLAEQLADAPAVHVISLGCGGGQKDLQLLRRLSAVEPGTKQREWSAAVSETNRSSAVEGRRQGQAARASDSQGSATAPEDRTQPRFTCVPTSPRRLSYSPVDVSVGLTLTARDAATEVIDPADCHSLVCDLQSADDLPEILDSHTPPEARRIILFFGMLPNFEPDEILGRLAGLLRKDDLLLCSANLAPGADYDAGIRQVLPQYDNAATRNWLAALPNDLGVGIDPGDIEFAITACADAPAVKRIEATCVVPADAVIHLGAESISFQAGERLRLFYSCRHKSALLANALAPHKLQISREWPASSEEEGVYQIGRREID